MLYTISNITRRLLRRSIRLAEVFYMGPFSSRLARLVYAFQARPCQVSQPVCPYKRKECFTKNSTSKQLKNSTSKQLKNSTSKQLKSSLRKLHEYILASVVELLLLCTYPKLFHRLNLYTQLYHEIILHLLVFNIKSFSLVIVPLAQINFIY